MNSDTQLYVESLTGLISISPPGGWCQEQGAKGSGSQTPHIYPEMPHS